MERFVQPLRLQPIPYQGSKRQLAPRICNLFPRDQVETLYEPFAGSAAVTVFAAQHQLARSFVLGDVFAELIDLWELIINRSDVVIQGYQKLWEQQFKVGSEHFNLMRDAYNADRDPVVLLYLIARCVKNAVRFNKNGDFTQSVDKRRTGVQPEKLGATIHQVSNLLRGRTTLVRGDFLSCVADAKPHDLVYMDPPYQGTTYGTDKRYVAQLERDQLVDGLGWLNSRDIPFILSYDGTTGQKVYADPLPADLSIIRLSIHAGRSSQATLAGRNEDTIESLYISDNLALSCNALPDYSLPTKRRPDLFAAA